MILTDALAVIIMMLGGFVLCIVGTYNQVHKRTPEHKTGQRIKDVAILSIISK